MLTLNEIKINNFLSHENTHIVFKENQKILLDGKSGSGKSSVIDAILWGLYGEARVDNRNLVRRGSKKTVVSLKLSDGSKQTVITRSSTDKGKNELAVTQSVDGKPFVHIDKVGLKDIQMWIENELIRASYSLFTNGVAYPQDNQNSFIKANATDRKNLLLEIIRAGDLDSYYEKAKNALATEETNSIVIFSKIEELEKNIKTFEPIAMRVEETQKKIEKYALESAVVVAQEKKLETEINDIKIIEIQLRNQESRNNKIISDIATKTSDINKKQSRIQQNLSIDITTAKQNTDKSKIVFEEILGIEKKLKLAAETQSKINVCLSKRPPVYDYTKDIESLNRQLIPLIKDSGKCPSGEDCPFTIPIRGQISYLQEQIAEKNKRAEENKIAINKWTEEFVLLPKTEDTTADYKKYGELKETHRQLSSYESVVLKHELSLKENEELNIQIEELKKLITSDLLESQEVEKEISILRLKLMNSNITYLNNELEKTRASIVEIRIKESEAIRQHVIATQARDSVVNARKGIADLQKEVNETKDKLECLKLVKEAFGSKGIKAVIIDYLVPELESRINDILIQLSDFRIKLDTQQEKTSEDGMKEGLFITVANEKGEELPFDSFSGGEKIKITIAISEAIASLMGQVGFRIIDEAIVSLDKDSTESFVEALEKIQEKFPQLLIVSHLDEIKDIFEDKIMITKVNGVSKINDILI